MSEPGQPLLVLEGIAMRYPGRDGSGPLSVLDGIDLELRPGELLCVAGRSGSGKTTLLNIAAGLLRPSAGSVWWQGRDLAGLDEDRLAQLRGESIGIVFQSSGLIPSLTAAENVALPGMPRGVKADGRRRARELLEQLGIAGRERHFPAQLSGGEQQRVAVARALYADPAALLVDEPTANLDRATADQVIELLVGLRSAGRGLLVASHDTSVVERADRAVRLE